MSARTAAVLALGLAACACAPGAGGPAGARTYRNPEQGISIDLPQGWRAFGDELKSDGGTLVNWQVKSLEGADPSFVAGLPDSIVPELAAWTRHYFGTFEDRGRTPGTVGGEPALVVTHQVQVPNQGAPSIARYWVVRRGPILYLLRAVHPAGHEAEEDPAVRALLGAFRFTSPASPPPS